MKPETREMLSLSILPDPKEENPLAFDFFWKGDTVILNHEEKNIALHELNYENYGSLLSLGCLLKKIRTTAEENGLKVKIHLDSDSPLKNIAIDFYEAEKNRFFEKMRSFFKFKNKKGAV